LLACLPEFKITGRIGLQIYFCAFFTTDRFKSKKKIYKKAAYLAMIYRLIVSFSCDKIYFEH
ncbi:hypothetical protein, partial [Ferruginibacter sp.]|uniref:hypothetical protein n=1 Tax=Ferruginibacter sp. TaxID=1940288 RepID=UPI00265AABB2